MKRSIIIWTIALILVAVAVYTTYQYNHTPAPAAEQTETQPDVSSVPPPEQTGNVIEESIDPIDFKLKDLSGKEVSLSDYKGKTIYINFWATWCPACKEELPFIQQLYNERKDTSLVILAVDLQESQSTVSKFMNDNKYDFPVLLDKDGKVATDYGVQRIPLSLLIDKNFKIISAREGAMEDYEALKEFVDQAK